MNYTTAVEGIKALHKLEKQFLYIQAPVELIDINVVLVRY